MTRRCLSWCRRRSVPAKQLVPPVVAAPDDRETVRQQLVAAALRLQALLDANWQKYLALPSEVFTGQPLPRGGLIRRVPAALSRRLQRSSLLGAERAS